MPASRTPADNGRVLKIFEVGKAEFFRAAVVLNDDVLLFQSHRIDDLFNARNLAAYAGKDVCGNRARRFRDHLPLDHVVADVHNGSRGRADMLGNCLSSPFRARASFLSAFRGRVPCGPLRARRTDIFCL